MFISKKKFEYEISKAKKEVWQENERHKFQNDIWKEIYDIKERLDRVEGKQVKHEAVAVCCKE